MKRVLWVLLILNSLAGMAMAQVGHITLTPGSAISASAMQTYLNTLADAINSLVLVGTVIASTLTKDQMNTLYPDGMWVLADGTAAPNPSAYRT